CPWLSGTGGGRQATIARAFFYPLFEKENAYVVDFLASNQEPRRIRWARRLRHEDHLRRTTHSPRAPIGHRSERPALLREGDEPDEETAAVHHWHGPLLWSLLGQHVVHPSALLPFARDVSRCDHRVLVLRGEIGSRSESPREQADQGVHPHLRRTAAAEFLDPRPGW